MFAYISSLSFKWPIILTSTHPGTFTECPKQSAVKWTALEKYLKSSKFNLFSSSTWVIFKIYSTIYMYLFLNKWVLLSVFLLNSTPIKTKLCLYYVSACKRHETTKNKHVEKLLRGVCHFLLYRRQSVRPSPGYSPSLRLRLLLRLLL